MAYLLPEMPEELLDWNEKRRIIKFPWNAPVCMVPYGPDKAPWRGQYRRRMEPLETITLRVPDGPSKGTYGTLHINLVVNDNPNNEALKKPNMHLCGFDDMYLDVHFGIHYPLNNKPPKDALVDPDLDYDEDPLWPKEKDGKPVPHDDPRIPRWARPWDEVANGGFPIPEDMIAGVALQLAFKKYGILNSLAQRWIDVHSQAWNVIRSRNVRKDLQTKIGDAMVHMFKTFEHPDVDREFKADCWDEGVNLVPVLLPRTVSGLKAMLAALNQCMANHAPKQLFSMEIDVEASVKGVHDLGAPHRTMSQEAERLGLLIQRLQFGIEFDPVGEGFSCAEDLCNFARKSDVTRFFPDDLLTQMSRAAFAKFEKNYPSLGEVAKQIEEGMALAMELTRHMSDEDVAKWFEAQDEKSKRPDFKDVVPCGRNDEAANKRVLEQSGLLPTLSMDLDDQERVICHERYGQSQMPDGKLVLQFVADAYIKTLVKRRDRGLFKRAVRAEANAAKMAKLRAAGVGAEPTPVRGPAQPGTQPAPAASQPKSGASHSDHVDAADLAAQTTRNKEEAERQREVRRQAEAAAEARQPRAYSAAGPSHKEGAPKWEAEVPDAGNKAKSDVARETSKEAKARRRREKRAATRAELEHRMWQLEQIRIGDAIGGK